MSDTLDAAGALATAGLVAQQVEAGRGGPHGAGGHGGDCRNCGAALTGAYCHVCGQSAHVHRSLLHLGEELLHGLLHFDAKGWRTLPLLVARPGVLTRRYIDGQRMRYVSPLALFLFMVFLMFFVFGATSGGAGFAGVGQRGQAQSRLELASEADTAKAEVAKAEAALRQQQRPAAGGAAPDPDDVADAATALATARAEQRAAEAALRAFDLAVQAAPAAARTADRAPATASAASAAASGAPASDAAVVLGVDDGRGWHDVRRRLGNASASVDTGSPRLDAAIRHAFDNPELALYKLRSSASTYAFMLVPISLPFLWLMFGGRRGVTMYDHAVFALYSLSFMSLLFVVAALLPLVHAAGLVPWLLVLVPPLHMAAQLRHAYGLGTVSTVWRTVVLLGVAALTFALFAAFVVAVAVV